MAREVRRHKVFVSYHHERDQKYADMLRAALADDMVDKSVHEDDIDNRNIKTATIRQKIRDNFIADATVTIVLVGPETYTRKHVDWEIGSSLRKTKKSPQRCGLLGIILPNHPDYRKPRRDFLIPPRLAANLQGQDRYAQIYNWPENNSLVRIRRWIHQAFLRRDGTPPRNSLKPFKNNRKPINPRAPSRTAGTRKRTQAKPKVQSRAQQAARRGSAPQSSRRS